MGQRRYADGAEKQRHYRRREKAKTLEEDGAFAYTGRRWVDTYTIGEPHPYLPELIPEVKIVPPVWRQIIDWANYFDLEGRPFIETKAQTEWIRTLHAYQFVLLNAPRGHGKTYTATYLLPIYYVCEVPNISILAISASKDLAGDYSDAIRGTFEQNDKLRAFYGSFNEGIDEYGKVQKAKKWATQAWTVPHRTIVKKEPTLQVAGVGSSIIGKHPDLIITDDLVQMEEEWSISSARKREKWFKTVVKPMITPELFGSQGEGSESKIWVLGTRKAPQDIYQVIKEMEIFYCKSYRAINQYPTSWNYVYDEESVLVGVDKIKGSYDILMPEVWSIELLLKEERAIGKRIFSSEYQNNPVSEEGDVFKWEDVRFWMRLSDEAKKGMQIYQWLDSALGEKGRSWSVLLTLGVYKNQFYILDIERAHWGFNQNIRAMERGYAKHHPLYNGTEAIMFQATIAQQVKAQTTLPLVTRGQEDLRHLKKIDRIKSIDVHFENHRVLINPNLKEFENFKMELLGFPNYETNDILDALEGAIWLYHNKRATQPTILFYD